MRAMVWLGIGIVVLAVVLAGAVLRARANDTVQRNSVREDAMSEKPGSDRPDDADLRRRLSPLQYEVTQKEATERPFANAYWDNHEDGVYVDVVSGKPLFSSKDKFDSGTGWPSFTQPIDPAAVTTKRDSNAWLGERTEVRSQDADSHLGHVFDDGPGPSGLRYCINSAALRFVPAESLAAEGYETLASEFDGVAQVGGEPAAPAKSTARATATLAGGCFWGMEDLIRKIPGVLGTEVGYTGGESPNATYEKVKKGSTGHAESVQITFDPARVSYEQILEWFFKIHDPTTTNRQGNDVGTQYRSAIFYHDAEQKRVAEAVKARVDKSGAWKRPVVTEIVPAGEFWPAETYHQDYLEKNPGGYTCHYVRPLDFSEEGAKTK